MSWRAPFSANRTGVRVNAQLIDAETGAHLWADRFEEDVADLFQAARSGGGAIGNSLGNELFKAEAAKGARSKKPRRGSISLCAAKALLQEAFGNKDKNDAARALFEQALKIDPNQSEALAGEAEPILTKMLGQTPRPTIFSLFGALTRQKYLDQGRQGHRARSR